MLEKSPIFKSDIPKDVRVNPIRSAEDWNSMRQACEEDAGQFHGDIAASTLHWFHPGTHSWLSKNEAGAWSGWDATGAEIGLKDLDWTPWETAFDDSDAPFYRWLDGGLTNAAFNEVDRHVLSGHGDEVAFWYEGDR